MYLCIRLKRQEIKLITPNTNISLLSIKVYLHRSLTTLLQPCIMYNVPCIIGTHLPPKNHEYPKYLSELYLCPGVQQFWPYLFKLADDVPEQWGAGYPCKEHAVLASARGLPLLQGVLLSPVRSSILCFHCYGCFYKLLALWFLIQIIKHC